ncbi:unnamed protein product, partial [Staurois parvus]
FRLSHVISCVQSQLIALIIRALLSVDPSVPPVSASPSMPAASAHQCHISMPHAHQCNISAHLSCLSVFQCHLSMPVSADYQCASVPPISASEYRLSVPYMS